MVGTQLYIFSHRLVHTTSCFGPVYWPSSGCIINSISSYTICARGTHAHIVQLLVKFIIQPDNCQYTGPKHVVVCTNLCENIYSCVPTIYLIYLSDYIIDMKFIIKLQFLKEVSFLKFPYVLSTSSSLSIHLMNKSVICMTHIVDITLPKLNQETECFGRLSSVTSDVNINLT